MLTEADLAPLVQDFYASVLKREGELRLLGRLGGSDDDRRRRAERWSESAAQFRNDLGASRFETADFVAAGYIKKHGLSGKLDDIEVRQVQQAMLRAGIDLAETLAARFNGEFNFEPRDKLLKLELSKAAAAAQEFAETAPTVMRQPANAGAKRAPLFTIAAEKFRQRQLNQGNWDKHTAMQAKSTFRLFEQHCGDKTLDQYDRGDAASFRDVLLEVPASYSYAREFRNKTLVEIAAIAAGSEAERLSPRTAERHLAALSVLWASAIDTGHVATNIFSGLKLPQKQKANEQRKMWTPEKLRALFDTPIWRGCKSESRRAHKGDLLIRDEKFWLPIVALFSGMRQEEICQLTLADVRLEEGVWVFDVNRRGDSDTKNDTAIRLVPVHSQLQRLGFLDYVDQQRTTGGAHVFPLLEPGGASDRLGHNYAKFFTRYRQRCGIYEKLVDFHSLRHSATTFMTWGGIQENVIDYVTGHVRKGETARYTKGFRVTQTREAIEAIDPRVDLDHLLLARHAPASG